MPSLDERTAAMRDRVERLQAVGAQANLTPNRLQLLEDEFFGEDDERRASYEEKWLSICEQILTEETVSAVESQAAQAKLMQGITVPADP